MKYGLRMVNGYEWNYYRVIFIDIISKLLDYEK